MNPKHPMPPTARDTVDALVPLTTGSPAYGWRHERAKVVAATQGSEDALLDPMLDGLTLAERLQVAATLCSLSDMPALAQHYQERLAAQAPPASNAHLEVMLDFTRTLALNPVEGDRAALDRLTQAGLRAPDVVALAQLIGFVTYQVRLVAGLKALSGVDFANKAQSVTATSTPFVHPAHLPTPGQPVQVGGFTSATLDWKAWLPVLDLASASPHQLQVLAASHPKASTSDYYLTLAQQPRILEERSEVFNAIMYAPGGLPRSERELASSVVSRINGCVYCAAVHAQRFEQLTKRNDVIVQVFTDPDSAGTTARERAIVQVSAELTRRPGAFDAASLREVVATGLGPVEVLDLIHAIAIFAWANRLMLNLGEPVLPH